MAEWLKATFIFLRGPQKHESPFPLFSSFSHLWREETVVDDKCLRELTCTCLHVYRQFAECSCGNWNDGEFEVRKRMIKGLLGIT